MWYDLSYTNLSGKMCLMNKRDDLIKICDELEHCRNKLCYRNEIVCVKKKIKQYIGDDENKLLKLKVLVRMHDDGNKVNFFTYFSCIMSTLAFCLVIIYNTSPTLPTGAKDLSNYSQYALMALCVILFITVACIINNKKNNQRNYWCKHIAIVLEEMLKDKK